MRYIVVSKCSLNKGPDQHTHQHYLICTFVVRCLDSTMYRKVPKFSDARKLYCNYPKIGKKRLYHRVMHTKNADSIENSEDPDQTAPLGAVWSGSALFAQTNLSENLGSLR